MNHEQVRLTLEFEYQFYRLQSDDGALSEFLVRIGFKPNPDIAKLSDEQLKKLNFRIRQHLRSFSPR